MWLEGAGVGGVPLSGILSMGGAHGGSATIFMKIRVAVWVERGGGGSLTPDLMYLVC